MNEKIEIYFSDQMKMAEKKGVTQNLMREMYYLLNKLEEMGLLEPGEKRTIEDRMADIPNQQMSLLGLPTRAINGLKREGIKTKGQLREYILSGGLLRTRNIGLGTAELVIRKAIQKDVLTIKDLEDVQGGEPWKRMMTKIKKELHWREEG